MKSTRICFSRFMSPLSGFKLRLAVESVGRKAQSPVLTFRAWTNNINGFGIPFSFCFTANLFFAHKVAITPMAP